MKRATEQLRQKHQAMDEHLDRVVSAARAADWRECNVLWDQLERLLVDHIRFEESELLPKYSKLDALAENDAKLLTSEHDELLKRAEMLGDDLQLHHNSGGIQEFALLLRQHAKREDTMFHPWLDSQVTAS